MAEPHCTIPPLMVKLASMATELGLELGLDGVEPDGTWFITIASPGFFHESASAGWDW